MDIIITITSRVSLPPPPLRPTVHSAQLLLLGSKNASQSWSRLYAKPSCSSCLRVEEIHPLNSARATVGTQIFFEGIIH